MKNKFIILLISSILIFNSVPIYADSDDSKIDVSSYSERTVVAPLLVAPEAFNILTGMFVTAGLALNADEIYTFMARLYEKVDSGVFSTYKSYDEFEEDLLKNTKKENDPQDPKRQLFVVADSFVEKIKEMFEPSFTNNDDNTVSFNTSPFIPGEVVYISTQSPTLVKNVRISDSRLGTYYYGDLLFTPSFNDSDVLRFDVSAKSYGGEVDIKNHYIKSNVVDYKGFVTSNRYLYMKTPTSNQLPQDKHIFILSNVKDVYSGNIDFSKIPNSVVSSTYDPNGNINFKPPYNFGNGNNNNNNTELPSFPSLDEIDFTGFDFSSLGSLFENFKHKFPFSLPFDLHNILSAFSVEPQAPVFDVPLFSEFITIDLTQFNELANIVRMFVVACWVFGLFILTKTFGG